MTVVRIGPEVVNEVDVLEYAEALIQEHGWRQGERPSGASDSTEEGWNETANAGLSLHDAIGMACFRLSGETGSSLAAGGTRSSSSKDFPVGEGRDMRDRVTSIVHGRIRARTKRNRSDIEFNDAAKSVDAVLDVLRESIKEARKSGN